MSEKQSAIDELFRSIRKDELTFGISSRGYRPQLYRGEVDKAAAEYASLRDENKRLMEMLKELAGDEPINQDEMGGCVWCGGPSGLPHRRGMYASADPKDHYPYCAWVKARAEVAAAEYPKKEE